MAKFPYGGFGGEGDADVPWVKLATIQEYLEDGEALPPVLARWLGEAIKGASGDSAALLIELGLRKPQGRPSVWDDPEAPAPLQMLYSLTDGGKLSDEAAIKKVQTEFMTTDGSDRFSRQTLQR